MNIRIREELEKLSAEKQGTDAGKKLAKELSKVINAESKNKFELTLKADGVQVIKIKTTNTQDLVDAINNFAYVRKPKNKIIKFLMEKINYGRKKLR